MFLEIVLTLLPMVLTLGDSSTETIRDKAMVMSLVNITIEVKSNRIICPCWSKCNAMQLCTAVSMVPYADGRSGGKCHFTGLEFEEVKTNMVEKTDAVTLRGSPIKTLVDECSTLPPVEEDDTCSVRGTVLGMGKMEYLIFSCAKNFEEAKKLYCSQDGKLASLPNAEEYAAVKQGMTDLLLTDGYYYLNILWSDWVDWHLWGDGIKLPPKGDNLWKPDKPDLRENEKCVVWTPELNLDDIGCYAAVPFICQVKADWYIVKTRLAIGTDCHYDRILSDKTSKKFLIVKCEKSYTDSEAMCEEQGGKLASLSDEEEYRKIKNILDAKYEGLTDIWLDVSWQQTNYFWGDNEPLAAQGVSPWLLEKPDSGGSDGCARLSYKGNEGYGFDDTSCSRPFSFLCQID